MRVAALTGAARAGRRWIVAAAFAAASVALAPDHGASQTTQGVRAEALVQTSGRVLVRLEVRTSDAGAEAGAALPFRIFLPAGVRVEDVRSPSEEGGAPGRALEVSAEDPRLLRGVVPAAPSGGPVRLEYTVAAADGRALLDARGRFDVRIPIAIPDPAPEGSPEGFFVATVALPEGLVLWESMPTARAGAAELSLPVLPSLLRLRGGRGDPPLLTPPRMADLGVGIVMVLLVAAVLLRMRRGSA